MGREWPSKEVCIQSFPLEKSIKAQEERNWSDPVWRGMVRDTVKAEQVREKRSRLNILLGGPGDNVQTV